jgi:hypothetical protein
MADLTPEQLQKKFREVTALPTDGQTKYFLKAFATDFIGSFQSVLDLAGEFQRFAPSQDAPDLDEFQAHRFLEKKNETLTVVELRSFLNELDLDKNKRLAFIEYLLYKYKKTLVQLFTPPPGGPSPAALAALDEAITTYQLVVNKKNTFEKRREELLKIIAEEKGVKKADAQKELDTIKGAYEINLQKDAMNAKGAKARAQKAVEDSIKNPDPDLAYREEQARLEREKKAKQDEEERQRKEARAALKARTAQWQQG